MARRFHTLPPGGKPFIASTESVHLAMARCPCSKRHDNFLSEGRGRPLIEWVRVRNRTPDIVRSLSPCAWRGLRCTRTTHAVWHEQTSAIPFLADDGLDRDRHEAAGDKDGESNHTKVPRWDTLVGDGASPQR